MFRYTSRWVDDKLAQKTRQTTQFIHQWWWVSQSLHGPPWIFPWIFHRWWARSHRPHITSRSGPSWTSFLRRTWGETCRDEGMKLVDRTLSGRHPLGETQHFFAGNHQFWWVKSGKTIRNGDKLVDFARLICRREAAETLLQWSWRFSWRRIAIRWWYW